MRRDIFPVFFVVVRGHWQCGGMYGVSARQNLSGVMGWTYSVRDADAWRCPLTEMPSCLSSVQFLSCLEIREVLVIRENRGGMLGSLQVVSPLVKCPDNCQ